jgi:hypothetical protein
VRQGSWLTQDPQVGGYSATEAYPPVEEDRATVTTYTPAAFDDQGNYKNGSDAVFHALAAYVSPADAVPRPPSKWVMGMTGVTLQRGALVAPME